MQGQLFDAGQLIPHTLGQNATPSPVGSGPAGETCRSCIHATNGQYHDYAYWKCGLVQISRGAGTDIRLKWPACRQWEPIVKVFGWKQIREAEQHAVNGGQSIHLHRIVFDRSPACFRQAVARGEDIAHFLDQDLERLRATVRKLGVRVIVVEHQGEPWQHVDLCGGPLKKALSMITQQEV